VEASRFTVMQRDYIMRLVEQIGALLAKIAQYGADE
jgi:hypothetical protein